MRRWRRAIYALGFTLICAGVCIYLSHFMAADNPYIAFDWDEAFLVEADGSHTPIRLDEYLALRDGDRYVLRAWLEEIPAESFTWLDPAGLSGSMRINGETVFEFSANLHAASAAASIVRIPLDTGAQACEVELELCVTDARYALFPSFGRISSPNLESTFSIASTNMYAIPAGACALAFILLCGAFLMGLARGRRDFSPLLAALAAGLATLRALALGSGVYLMSPALCNALCRPEMRYLISALLAAYLALNWKNGYVRMFGRVVLWTCFVIGLLAIAVVVGELLFPGVFARVDALFARYDRSMLLFLLQAFLTLCCAGISVYGLARGLLRLQAEKKALEMRNEMTLQGYHALREQAQATSLMRHEWKNRLLALDLLLKKGEHAQLGEALATLTGELEHSNMRTYTENLSVDLILQDVAARARKGDIAFRASVAIPERLEIREQDLCSVLMNMFNNALKAAGAVEPPEARYITCKMQYRQGFWAIYCSNSFVEHAQPAQQSAPAMNAPEEGAHGLGLRQMRQTAEKYNGAMQIERKGGCFTVQMALKV